MGELKRLERLVAAIDRDDDAFGARCARITDWQPLVDLAFEHGVAGILLHRLGAAGVRLPPPLLADAGERLATDRLWWRRTRADLEAVQGAFEGAGVRAVVLKGPPLAERIYPRAALRPAGDLDFLVTPETFAAAGAALEGLGFDRTPDPPTPWRRHATGFESPTRARVELHWQASSKLGTSLASRPLVERAVAYPLGSGRQALILEPADELLYLAVHAARHRFARLRWLWEIGALVDRCDDRALELLVERAVRARVARPVAVTLGMLERRLDVERARDHARRLPRGLWLRAELRVAGLATDPAYRRRGILWKSASVVGDHTYRALLAETTAKALGHWTGAIRRSLGNLVRRRATPSPRRLRCGLLGALLAALLAGCAPSPPSADSSPSDGLSPPIRAVPLTAVTVHDGFWTPRLERNRTVTIPHIMEQNVLTGRVANFAKAAGLEEGRYEGRRFNDTDVYKAVEAASWALARRHDPALERQLDALIALIAAAQQDDGYLFPALTIDPDNPALGVGRERWTHVAAGSHELYNAGHLIEAAVAHHRATGKRTLLEVAIRFADRIDEDFGPDARHDIPGHEEIELALVKLADATGESRYLDLARFFIDQRGQEHDSEPYPADTDFAIYNDRPYKQDHRPVTEQTSASGHAVRATYLYAGMADVAARTAAPGYREALEAIWRDIVAHKLYLTGAIGARGTFESFGENYELPNRAYGETCAAVGFEQWNHRMFLASGDVEYLDVMERTLYNGFLSGVSQAGDTFFYTNVLESSGEDERAPYFDVACCPANLARTLALLPGFVYAQSGPRVWVELYVGSEARLELPGGPLTVTQETDYPWDGRVRLEITPDSPIDFELALRVPGWARERPVPSDLYRFADARPGGIRLAVNGEPLEVVEPPDGLLLVARRWQPGDVVELTLPMPVRRVVAHPSLADAAGKTAIQRGPLVYAVEAADNDGAVLDLALAAEPRLTAVFDPDRLDGVVVVRGRATRAGAAGPAPHELLAIPYFAWANRGAGEMAVWLPAPRPSLAAVLAFPTDPRRE